MLPLAQTPEVPTAAYVLIVGALVVAVIMAGVLFTSLRKFRANIADELKRELAVSAQPQRVDVQSPLEIRHAAEFVLRAEHQKEVHEIKEELKRHAARRAEIYDRQKEMNGELRSIKATNEGQSTMLGELRSDSKANASKVDTMIGEMKQLTTQMYQLTLAIRSKGQRE